jgi:hypothetical protein
MATEIKKYNSRVKETPALLLKISKDWEPGKSIEYHPRGRKAKAKITISKNGRVYLRVVKTKKPWSKQWISQKRERLSYV